MSMSMPHASGVLSASAAACFVAAMVQYGAQRQVKVQQVSRLCQGAPTV